MRKTIRCLTFIVILTLTLLLTNYILKFKSSDGNYSIETFYQLPENSVDVLALGSSHCYVDINPNILWKDNGVAAYDLCGSMQPMWNSYYYLEEALKTQQPKLVILEAWSLTAYHGADYGNELTVVSNLFGMRWNNTKLQALMASVPEKQRIDYGLQYIKYHNRYKNLLPEDFLPYRGNKNYWKHWKGFINLFNVVPIENSQALDVTKVETRIDLSKKNEKYYRMILDLAKKNKIDVMVVVSPYIQISETDQSIFNKAYDIAGEYGAKFVNGNLILEELEIDFTKDAADVGHLNYKGNKKWTSYLSNYIDKNYSLPDRRNDERWDSWNMSATFYEKQLEEEALKSIQNPAEYMRELSKLEDYIICITLDGDQNRLNEQIVSLLSSLGLYRFDCSTWVLENKKIIFQNNINNFPFTYVKDSGINNIAIVGKDDLTKTIYYNRIPQKRINNGINVIVYNNYTSNLVDVFGVDAGNPNSIVR